MNINYHYYTIKTLAHYAGFGDKAAQLVAHFSYMVDDFIMRIPFIVAERPPDFFIEHGLARELSANKWVFLPCPTGPSKIYSVFSDYRLHNLMPFHFITTVPFCEFPENTDRNLYRCVSANQKDNLLINELIEKTVKSTTLDDEKSLMALGMILHTYADTYAHNGFSGFLGWENKSYISKMEHKLPDSESGIFAKVWRFIREKILGRKESTSDLSPAEIIFYSLSPSIAHANAFTAPDYCDCKISLYMKESKDGTMKPMIERDNAQFFSICSRRILDMLCLISGKPRYDDSEWEALQSKLWDAQNVRNQHDRKANEKKWKTVFPNVNYKYDKDEFLKVKLEILHKNKALADELGVSNRDLIDMNSEKGERVRETSIMIAEEVNSMFYTYNELAYRHVYSVTGKHTFDDSLEHLANYVEHDWDMSVFGKE